MSQNDHLQRYLELCRRMYLRMLKDGSWPWKKEPDSRNSEDVVESENADHEL